MKCKQCDTVLTGRQREFCSDKCRKRASRTQPGPQIGSGSTNADKVILNYPPNADKPEVGHRTPAIPGDPDYVGVCKEVDGVWVAKPDPVDITTLTATELQIRMKRYKGLDWLNSPEHKEVMHRLHTRTVAELESQFVPCWKYKQQDVREAVVGV